MSRYEIREREPSDLAREELSHTGPVFVVWDTWENKRVPFASYTDRERAERRIRRMEERER